jgi:hypothetical protein
MVNDQRRELDGQVALVTGSAKNIGRAINLALADAGAKVVINALTSRAEAQSLAAEINDAGGEAMAHIADIRDPSFDHTIRSGNEADQESKRLREPVKVVHNDYTEWSGPQRLRDLLPAHEAEALLRHRVAVIQVWRPIRGPVLSSPLAICDAQSVAPADLIAAERHHPDRVGEIYQLAYNPGHRWYWFPQMRRDEALVFKC